MQPGERDPEDRWLPIVNVVGFSVVFGLIGTFFVLYGNQLVSLLSFFLGLGHEWP